MRKISILLFALFLPGLALAQEGSQKMEDLFVFAPDVRVIEPAPRDVVALGGKIEIADTVAQDVFALGGTIEITGDVVGDVRAAGNRVIINSRVGGNVAVLAKSVAMGPNAAIAGSVRIKAETVVMDGAIAQDAVIDAARFEQNGSISGALTYKKIENREPSQNAFSWFFRLAGLFGMLVIGLVLVSAFPRATRSAIGRSMKNPGKDFLWGIAALFGMPILVLVLMLTIIGFPLGMILLAMYLIALYLGQIFVGITLGTYLFGAYKGRKEVEKSSLLGIMALGVAVFWLITGIPYIGGALKLIAVVWGLGILANLKIAAFKKLEA